MGTITVGFDGSAGAEAALRFALREARLRHSDVRVVHAWLPTPYTTGTWGIGPFPHSVEDEIAAKRQIALGELRAHVTFAQRRAAAGDVAVEVVGREGPAEDVLVEDTRDADLLVVGTRGHSRLASLFLGSVSRSCARHATCPVVVVPPEPIDESRAHIAQLGDAAGVR
jgi:nucleotide-binding universal stress UspA family protein